VYGHELCCEAASREGSGAEKAHDSVPREALWMALRKLGASEQLVPIVKSFHEGMEAKVRPCDELLDNIQVIMDRGMDALWLHHGSTCDGRGTRLLYKLGHKLHSSNAS